jgi:hypothetical protein
MAIDIEAEQKRKSQKRRKKWKTESGIRSALLPKTMNTPGWLASYANKQMITLQFWYEFLHTLQK